VFPYFSFFSNTRVEQMHRRLQVAYDDHTAMLLGVGLAATCIFLLVLLVIYAKSFKPGASIPEELRRGSSIWDSERDEEESKPMVRSKAPPSSPLARNVVPDDQRAALEAYVKRPAVVAPGSPRVPDEQRAALAAYMQSP
jgi:hypothetical protein